MDRHDLQKHEGRSEPTSIALPMSRKESFLSAAAVKEKIEEKYLQHTRDGMDSATITCCGIDSSVVDLKVDCRKVRFHTMSMLNSRFSRENLLSAVKFADSGSEVFVEKISSKLLNCTVTVGSVSLTARGCTVHVDANNIRVSNMDEVRKNFATSGKKSKVVLLQGISLQAMIHT